MQLKEIVLTLVARLWGWYKPETEPEHVYSKYIRYGSKGLSKAELAILDLTQVVIEKQLRSRIDEKVKAKSAFASMIRTRTTTSDRLIQPQLISTARRSTGSGGAPGSKFTLNDSEWKEEKSGPPEADQYSQISIPIHVALFNFYIPAGHFRWRGLIDKLADHYVTCQVELYDSIMWDGGVAKVTDLNFPGQNIPADPTIDTARPGAILNHASVKGWQSKGVSTVAGYIETTPDDASLVDGFKKMLFHMPQSYRANCIWYMNERTAKRLSRAVGEDMMPVIDPRQSDDPTAKFLPITLLGKPIRLNNYMPDIAPGNFPVMLADLSRGYIVGHKNSEMTMRRFGVHDNWPQNAAGVILGRVRIGGQVLQPACFKVMKIVEQYTPEPSPAPEPAPTPEPAAEQAAIDDLVNLIKTSNDRGAIADAANQLIERSRRQRLDGVNVQRAEGDGTAVQVQVGGKGNSQTIK